MNCQFFSYKINELGGQRNLKYRRRKDIFLSQQTILQNIFFYFYLDVKPQVLQNIYGVVRTPNKSFPSHDVQ